MIRALLAGAPGPARDIVILNAAAALITAGKTSDPRAAAKLAAQAIDTGAAQSLLNRLAKRSHAPEQEPSNKREGEAPTEPNHR
jgi:anthranilate phosphoribosyltransferase